MTHDDSPARMGRWTVVGLFALFFGPVFLAIGWYTLAPAYAPAPSANGTLIQPPRPLSGFRLSVASGGTFTADDLRGRWHLIQVIGDACRETCRERLHQTHQIRIALGINRLRVHRVMIAAEGIATPGMDGVDPATPGVHVLIPGADRSLLRKLPGYRTSGTVFLVDPHGNLMMRFGPEVPGTGILKDLEHLLELSRIG